MHLNLLLVKTLTFIGMYALLYRFTYAWAIPICGALPNNSNFPEIEFGDSWDPEPEFAVSSIWQFNLPARPEQLNYFIGNYSKDTWTIGRTQDGEFTLAFDALNGQFCEETNSPRVTHMYLQCNYSFTADDPFIEVVEFETCQCKLLLHRM
jgi:hypothetical protein